MKTLTFLIAFFVATAALADSDLAIVSMTPEKTTVATGERFRVALKVGNLGPAPARNVRLNILPAMTTSPLLDLTPAAGWTCTSARFATGASCTIPTFALGAEAEFSVTLIAPSSVYESYLLSASISSEEHDPAFPNNSRNAMVKLTAAARTSDLAVDALREVQVAPRAAVLHNVTVRNQGPDEARNLVVILRTQPVRQISGLTVSGSGWSCESVNLDAVACTRSSIAPHGSAPPLEVRFTAPATEIPLHLNVTAIAESSLDPEPLNGGSIIFNVGAAEDWRMMLVPLVRDDIPGANGSLWKTDLWMYIASDTAVEVRPHNCQWTIIPACITADPQPREEFDPRRTGQLTGGDDVLGQFLYIPRNDFDKVRMNARIYDQSRRTQTAGAEIPIPRDDEFTTGTIDLLNIPVAPQYRHTLRVYDAEGRSGTRVRIRVFTNQSIEPRVVSEQTLVTSQRQIPVTGARLPSHPAVLQLNLDQLLPLAGLQPVRVEVSPVERGSRIWAFVSITNNDTHHVTTVTPQ